MRFFYRRFNTTGDPASAFEVARILSAPPDGAAPHPRLIDRLRPHPELASGNRGTQQSGIRAEDYFFRAGSIGDILRSGPLARGIPVHDIDTIWDHQLAVRDIAVVVAIRRELNVSLVEVFALGHDLPEAITGDFIHDRYATAQLLPYLTAPPDKPRREAAALKLINAGCGNALDRKIPSIGMSALAAIHLYEQKSIPEAHLVKASDQLQAIIEASELGVNYPDARDGFTNMVDSTLPEMTDPELKAIAEIIIERAPVEKDLYRFAMKLLHSDLVAQKKSGGLNQ